LYPSWEAKLGRRVRLAALPPSVSQLYIKCGILYVSQHYRPPACYKGSFNLNYWIEDSFTFFYHRNRVQSGDCSWGDNWLKVKSRKVTRRVTRWSHSLVLQAKTITAFIIGPKASEENWCQQVATFLSGGCSGTRGDGTSGAVSCTGNLWSRVTYLNEQETENEISNECQEVETTTFPSISRKLSFRMKL
jgi:hypothetical protein